MSERGADGGQGEPSAEECVRAGMYWFGRSDFAAAEAWWQRALELDPRNIRAQECLRLLHRTSSTGFKPDVLNPFDGRAEPRQRGPGSDGASRVQEASRWPGPSSHPAMEAPRGVDRISGGHDLSGDLEGEFSRLAAAAGGPGRSAPASSGLGAATQRGPASPARGARPETGGRGLGAAPPHRSGEAARPRAAPAGGGGGRRAGLASARGSLSSDPFEFVAGAWAPAADERPPSGAVSPVRSPWDDGPSRTSAVTLRDEGGFDAVAEPTPLPELDRERFFGRGDPVSSQEIFEYLRATGDLPPVVGSGVNEEIIFDEPVELEEPEDEPVTTSSPEALVRAARDRFSLHDFDGVLELIERLPPEHAGTEEARKLSAEARKNLLRMYEARIGDFGRTPRVLISSEEVIWLNLNHRAGFILSQIDGSVTYDDLVALSGMPRLDTVRILAQLLQERVIG